MAGRRAGEGIPGKVGGGVPGAGDREEGWGRYTREGRGRGPGSWGPGGGSGGLVTLTLAKCRSYIFILKPKGLTQL